MILGLDRLYCCLVLAQHQLPEVRLSAALPDSRLLVMWLFAIAGSLRFSFRRFQQFSPRDSIYRTRLNPHTVRLAFFLFQERLVVGFEQSCFIALDRLCFLVHADEEYHPLHQVPPQSCRLQTSMIY